MDSLKNFSAAIKQVIDPSSLSVGDETIMLGVLMLVLEVTIFFEIATSCWWKGSKKLKLFNDSCSQTAANKHVSGLETIPGPRLFLGSRFLGNLFELPSPSNLLPGCFNLVKKYGTCFKMTVFNKNLVLVADADIAKTLLSSNNVSHATKAWVYKFLSDNIKGLAFSHGERWRKMRGIVGNSFHYDNQATHVAFYNFHADKLIKKLYTLETDKEVTLLELISKLYVQIIIDTFAGGPCPDYESLEYARSFKIYFETLAYRMLRPWLLLESVWRIHPKGKEYMKARETMEKFVEQTYERFFQNNPTADKPDDKNSLISRLIKLNVPADEIKQEIAALLFAHETNALALYYFIFLLASNPEHQLICRNEVDALFADKSSYSISLSDLPLLHHVERCMLESLRLLSPVQIFGRNLEQPLHIQKGEIDATLPIETDVLILSAVIHRNPEYFPNPDSFEPDRWAMDKGGRGTRPPQYSFLPYSGGARVCLGMKTSQMNMKIIVAKVLQHFEISTEDRLCDVKFRYNLTMLPEKELKIKFRPRRH